MALEIINLIKISNFVYLSVDKLTTSCFEYRKQLRKIELLETYEKIKNQNDLIDENPEKIELEKNLEKEERKLNFLHEILKKEIEYIQEKLNKKLEEEKIDDEVVIENNLYADWGKLMKKQNYEKKTLEQKSPGTEIEMRKLINIENKLSENKKNIKIIDEKINYLKNLSNSVSEELGKMKMELYLGENWKEWKSLVKSEKLRKKIEKIETILQKLFRSKRF